LAAERRRRSGGFVVSSGLDFRSDGGLASSCRIDLTSDLEDLSSVRCDSGGEGGSDGGGEPDGEAANRAMSRISAAERRNKKLAFCLFAKDCWRERGDSIALSEELGVATLDPIRAKKRDYTSTNWGGHSVFYA